MFRLYLFGAALLGLVSASAGLVMLCQSALNTAFARGQAAGRAEINAQVQHQLELAHTSSLAIADEASRKVSKLEDARVQMQSQLDAAIEAGQHSARSRHVCLDSGLVHALNAIGAAVAGHGGAP